jgi:FAD/FMN-containing dehydrogenase
MSVQLRTLMPGQVTVPDDEMDDFRAGFHGSMIGPGEATYEQACEVQNAAFHRHPGLILRCSGTADVVDAVVLAHQRDLLIAVRGGGHSVAGHSITDGGLLIDLSGMRGVWVDPVRRTVRVQGGATWGDVDREAQLFGLAVPGGIVSTTGVGGLTLGGGIGWLHRKYGLTCDSLRAAEVVTSDGHVLQVDEDTHPDLLWALRGGGGNFGIVTTFEFDAYPVGPTVMNAAVVYPAQIADRVLPEWRSWAETVPDEVTTRAVLWTMPADPHLSPAVHDQDVLILGAVYSGSVETGEEVVAPIRHLGTPLADLSAPTPYRVVQSLFDPFFPKGELLSYWKSIYLDPLGNEAIKMIVDRAGDRPHPRTIIHVPLLGGAMERVTATATAFGDRSPRYMLSVDGNWLDAADTARGTTWVKQTITEAGRLPSAAGTYLNFSGDTDLDTTERQAAFGSNLERLVQVKTKYDPQNRLRLNNNIEPAS